MCYNKYQWQCTRTVRWTFTTLFIFTKPKLWYTLLMYNEQCHRIQRWKQAIQLAMTICVIHHSKPTIYKTGKKVTQQDFIYNNFMSENKQLILQDAKTGFHTMLGKYKCQQNYVL